MDSGNEIGVTLLLRAWPGSPPLPKLGDWHATPMRDRRALSRDEYARNHGADPADLEMVAAFASANGLRVVESHAGRRAVTLLGTAGQFAVAFNVTLNHYEGPLPIGGKRASHRSDHGSGGDEAALRMHVHHGYDGPIHLPDELDGIVVAVVGLDDRARGVPAGMPAGDPSGASALSVPTLAQRYNFPNPGAADQTIGVIAPSAPGVVAAYLSNDIRNTYFPSLPAGFTTKPTITDVNLTVSGTTFQNSPAAVQAITAANLGSSANGGILELTQDISTAATIAQGATVNVYFTSSSEQGWLVFLNRVLMPETENAPTVVTCSWTLELGDESGFIGNLSDSGSIVSQMTAQFQALAAVGVDVFIAQGDWGADNWWPLGNSPPTAPDGKSHVMYPASDAWVTSCGGTALGTSEEWAWGDAYSNSSFGSSYSNRAATGGGVSKTFTPAPAYQTAAGITGATDSAGTAHSGRGVPDVAALVWLNGFFANGNSYNFIGTSCVAPFCAGLAAVIRSALGVSLGPLNDALYALKDVAFNDVTVGDNNSNDTPANVALAIPGYTGTTPNAPFFSAGAGWDACTGLGSIDGTKLLDGIASMLYNPNFYFQVNKGSFGLDEVNVTPSYPEALWLVLEGFTPDAVSAAGIAPIINASVAGVTITVGVGQAEIQTQRSTPQRVLFPCTVGFTSSAMRTVSQGGIFPSPGNPPTPTTVSLISSVTIGGRIFSAETNLELEPGADPFFSNFDPSGGNPFWLSQDLRVFTVTPGVNNAPTDGIALNSSNSRSLDTGAGYAYIQALLARLNSSYNSSPSGDAFSRFPDQSNALTADSLVSPTTLDPANPTRAGFVNYTFAVARVRLSGAANSSSGANVRVLFRLFAAQTSDTDYQQLTYPSTLDAEGQPLAPQLGAGAVTIPFFATGNFESNSDFAVNVDYSANSVNNQPIPIGASGEAFAYYGCYLNIYPGGNTINGHAVQTLLPSTHSCLVAQLVYDDAPMPTGPGVVQGPEYSDNFAQRNLQITHSDNPGSAAGHRVPQTFDVRPGPTPGSGELERYPDELMIDWGDTPVGAKASIYWPQVDSADVLSLAKTFYSTHQLRQADPHTIECVVPAGFTFVPIPPAVGENYAGLFTVDLPDGLTAGQELTITVRRLSSRRGSVSAALPGKPAITGDVRDVATRAREQVMRNWRTIVGTFAVRIPISKARLMLPLEENTLAIMRWRLSQLLPTNRWVPVLERYLDLVERRVIGLGGDPTTIKPSPWGARGAPSETRGRSDEPGQHHDRYRHDEATGKIDGIFYDRFGDFTGFLLLTEEGAQRRYRSREAEIEALVRFAWERRALLSVQSDEHSRDLPIAVILRRSPPQPLPPV